MRILIVACVLPPLVHGGAEIAAMSLADWLADRGNEVGIFTIVREDPPTDAGRPADREPDRESAGARIFETSLPRVYHAADFARQGGVRKGVWHLQDHFAAVNRAAFGKVLDRFAPDVVNVHVLQGGGWNLLAELGARDIPTVLTIHDLGLACINTAMHKGGHDCRDHCLACRLSTRVKQRWLERIPRLAVTAPSHAVVDRLRAAGALRGIAAERIANVIPYPRPRPLADAGDRPDGGLRLLFVGTIAEHKGVEIAIRAAAALAGERRVTLDILGSGRDLERLRAEWAGTPWLRFHGQVPLTTVSDHMGAADLLLVPSTWRENAPGVVIQALELGLPVLASAVGGIPELVRDGVTGLLLPPGDQSAWTGAVQRLAAEPAGLDAIRAGAGQWREEFSPDHAGRRMEKKFEAVREQAV